MIKPFYKGGNGTMFFARKQCITKVVSEFSPGRLLWLVLGVLSAFLGVRFALEMVKFLPLT